MPTILKEPDCALERARAATVSGTTWGTFICQETGCSVSLNVKDGRIINEKAIAGNLCQLAILAQMANPTSPAK